MAPEANDVRRVAHTKIRTRIVAALANAFDIGQTTGLYIDWGHHIDTWLVLPPDFATRAVSDDSIVAALAKAFGITFARSAFIRFGDDQQGGDVWLPIPSDFLQGELSDAEIQAVVGRSIMIRWDILPGNVFGEGTPGEVMLIGVGTFPAKFFE